MKLEGLHICLTVSRWISIARKLSVAASFNRRYDCWLWRHVAIEVRPMQMMNR
jgi:hypothetical protein